MIIDKILDFIKLTGVSKSEFEKKVGLSNAYLANIKKTNSEVQPKMLEKMILAYPELESYLESKETIDLKNPIPLIPIEAMAGKAIGSMQVATEDIQENYFVPDFKGADFMIKVKGSSMYPKYNSGDIVACKKLCLTDLFFQWNKVYVLDTEQGALIKRIRKGKDENHILVVSDNEKYEPFDLHRSKLNAIALVIGVIRLE